VRSLVLISFLGVCPVALGADHWLTDYRAAREQARTEDKPILVYFSTDGVDPAWTFSEFDQLNDPFVLVHADKTSEDGKTLFNLFDVKADTAYVVIERGQEWQYCRYERKLGSREVENLFRGSARAIGKPEQDVLQSVAAESPAASMPQARSFYFNPNSPILGGATSSGSDCPRCRLMMGR
jgi:hypothetical protein